MTKSLAGWFFAKVGGSKLNLLVLLALIFGPLLVFGPAVNYEFVRWDDDVNIVNNAHVRSLGWAQLKWMFTDYRLAHRYMPMGWLCYAVERTLWIDDPFVFHFGNLILHVVNGVLLFTLLKRILSRAAEHANPISIRVIMAAGMGALFWALHPLRTEVVCWCSSRIYLMVTFWFMLSLFCYLRAFEDSRYSAWWHVAAGGLYIASLLTYPVLLFGSIIFVFLDMFVLKRIPTSFRQWSNPAWRRVWLEKLPYFLITAACLAVTLATRTAGQQRGYVETLEYFDLPHRIAQGFYAWAYYLWIPWYPLNLAPQYGVLLTFHPTELKFLASVALVIAVTGLAVWQARRWPVVLGLWLCHLVIYFPLIGLTEHPHSTYDRYTYMPGMLWASAITLILWTIWPHVRYRYLSIGVFTAIASVCVVLSSQQILVWQNTATVRLRIAANFGSHIAGAVNEEMAGRYYLGRNMLEPARECFARALTLWPEDVDSRIYLGDTLAQMGRNDEAFIEYNKVVRAKPPDLKARHNLGVALCKLGRFEDGAALFKEILAEDPGHVNASHNLTLALRKITANQSEEVRPVSNQEK